MSSRVWFVIYGALIDPIDKKAFNVWKNWEKFEDVPPVKTKKVNISNTKKGIDTIVCMDNQKSVFARFQSDFFCFFCFA